VAGDDCGGRNSRWTSTTKVGRALAHRIDTRRTTFTSTLMAAVVLASSTASAYCRTTTCDSKLEDCGVNPTTGCPITGIPLY